MWDFKADCLNFALCIKLLHSTSYGTVANIEMHIVRGYDRKGSDFANKNDVVNELMEYNEANDKQGSYQNEAYNERIVSITLLTE